MSGDYLEQTIENALAERRYIFSVHGQSQVWPGRQQQSRRRRSPQRTPYSVRNPEQFSLVKFSRAENLMHGFRILDAEGGHAPGNDGLKYEDFSPGEIWETMRFVSRALCAGTYRPHPTRLVRIPKPDGRERQLLLMTIVDRAIAKSLQLALATYWDSVLPNLRRGVWQIYAEMEVTIRNEGRYILTAADVRDCFPSIQIEDVLRCHRQHFHQPELLQLVETLIRGHEGPDHTQGLAQGSPCSPTQAELTLHHYLDRQLDIVAPGHPPLFRCKASVGSGIFCGLG